MLIDYTGFENEYIKVIKPSSDEVQKMRNEGKVKQGVYYETICKRCGKTYDLIDQNVMKVKSCGCYSKTKWMDTAEQHIGEKHNRLTITGVDWERTKTERESNRTKWRSIYYFTECECGKVPENSTSYQAMKSGHIKSCGCSKFNNPLIMEDLTGQKFGRLTVVTRDVERDLKEIEDNGTRHGNAHWLCKCDCGNSELKSVTGNQLKSGHTQSCGCYASEKIAERNRLYSSKYNRPEKYKDNLIDLSDISDGDFIRLYDENMEFSFIINKDDYPIVSRYYWRKLSEKEEPNPRKRYWVTNAKKEDMDNGSQSTFRLHQIIAKEKYGEYSKELMPDHLDKNPDNNTRRNLVLKTNPDNSKNRGLSRANTSGKTGVSQYKSGKFYAYITVNYKTIHLGTYVDFDDAVKARKEAETKYGFTTDDVNPQYDD